MANNFETLKNEVSTEKFSLVRMEPARDLSSFLALDAGTTYTYTIPKFSAKVTVRTFEFPMVISKVQVDGVDYDLVSGAPASGEYAYNETTGLFTINLGAPLTNQVVVVYYYLFLCSERARPAPQNPMDSSSRIRLYLPRVASDVSTTYDQSETTAGIISFSNSNIDIHNQDGFFEQFLTDDDSFSQKEIIVWACLNDVENVKRVFRGLTNNISVGKNVTIELFDEMSFLNKTFYPNGTFLNSTYNKTRFPNIHKDKENLPIRKVYAKTTYYKIVEDPASPPSYRVDHERLLEAVCVNYNETISTSNNREWGTILSTGDAGLQTDTVASVDNTDPGHTLITHGAGKKYLVGDTLTIGAEYAIVLNIESATQFKMQKNILVNTSDTITRAGISTVVIEQGGSVFFALYGRDYTVQHSGNTNDIVKITFVNNFEASLSMNPLDPNADVVRFRAWTDTASTYNHGTVLQEILEVAGFEVNAASITAANATSIETNFYVPYVGESELPPIFDVVQKFVYSTVGYITFNSDQEVEYHLFAAPSPAPDDESTDRDILLDSSLTTEVDYNDIIDSLSFENDHDILELTFSKEAIESKRAKYLHGVQRNRVVNHLMKDFSRKTVLMNILSERKARYSYVTKTKNLSNIIGDDIKLVKDGLIGDVSERDAKLVSITKRLGEVELTLDDLIGL
jgi:hypothetical protein